MNPTELRARASRAVEQERAARVESPEIADPHGSAARAAGIDPGELAKMRARGQEPSEIALTFEGAVERNAKKSGLGGLNSQGQLKLSLKAGGSLTGEILLTYLNRPDLGSLSRLNRREQPRKFRVTVTIEEVEP